MLKNYLRVTFRNLIRHRLYTLINVLGLAVGVRGVRGVLLALVVAMATTSTQFSRPLNKWCFLDVRDDRDAGSIDWFSISLLRR